MSKPDQNQEPKEPLSLTLKTIEIIDSLMRIEKMGVIVGVVLIGVTHGALWSTEEPTVKAEALTADSEDVTKIVVALEANLKATQSIVTKFKQEVIHGLTKLPLVPEHGGTFYFERPRRLRWEYDRPTKKTIIADGKSLYIHRPDDNEVNVVKDVSSFLQDARSRGDGFPFYIFEDGNLLAYFKDPTLDNGQDPLTISMGPRDSTSSLSKLTITLDAKTHFIQRLTIEESNQNRTIFTFSSLKRNQKMSPKKFEFKIPKGAHVTSQ